MAIEQIFFELIRVAIGTQDTLTSPPLRNEWAELYSMSKKQSLVGICFSAVQKLTQNQEPRTQNLDEVQYLTWMGMAAKIQQRNEVVNRQCVEVQDKLSSDGFSSCVLKGQGVASLYTSAGSAQVNDMRLLRQSGDIDLWVPGDYKKTIDYVRLSQPECSVVANHIVWDLFADTEVEVHPIPAIFRNPFTNRKWKKFCKEQENDWAEVNVDSTSSLFSFKTPSTEFNLVFLMVHMYQHLLREGIGLRQMMDYYFVLENRNKNHDNDDDNDNVLRIISELGMKRFAGGVMCIMESTFGMPHDLLLCEPDPEAGAELLSEIMTGGNFGHYDERNKVAFDNESNPIHRVWNGMKRNRRFLKYGFWEIVWSPIWRLWHFCWMKINGYR